MTHPDLTSLASQDWRERKRAIKELSQAGSESLAAALLAIVREEHGDMEALNAALQLLEVINAPVVPGLVQLLENPDLEVRTYAALTLGRLEDKATAAQAVPALLQQLRESCGAEGLVNVCFNIIEALGELGVLEAVETFREILATNNYFLKFAVVEALGQIGDSSTGPDLLRLFYDELLGDAAVAAFGKVGDEGSIHAIAHWMDYPASSPASAASAFNSLVCRKAAENEKEYERLTTLIAGEISSLGRLRLAQAVPLEKSQPLTDDQAASLRDLAVVLGWLLKAADPNEAAFIQEALARLLYHNHARRSAASALARSAQPSFIELAYKLLDPNGAETVPLEVQLAVVQALGGLNTPASLKILVEALESEENELVIEAARSLAQLKAFAYFDLLVSKLDHPSRGVRRVVIDALREIDQPSYQAKMMELLESPSARLREAGAIGLAHPAGKAGAEEFSPVPALLEAMADSNVAVRRAAVEALCYYEDHQIPSALAEAMEDTDSAVRIAVVRSLVYCSPSLALPLLELGLHDAEPFVRMYSARSIGRIGSSESLSKLEQLREDPLPPVRAAFVEAQGEIAGQEAVPVLLDFLSDPAPEVQKAAEKALLSLKKRNNKNKKENQGGVLDCRYNG